MALYARISLAFFVKPCPSLSNNTYSTTPLRFLMLSTISSDSGLITRGSFAPCNTISGFTILSAWNNGDTARKFSRSVFGSPISLYSDLRNDSQYGGIDCNVRTQLETPNRSTPTANSCGFNASAARTMEQP